MSLAFIEVKKPNNHMGIKAERDRMNIRFKNPKFKHFINELQLFIFSNNMEYSDADRNKPEPNRRTCRAIHRTRQGCA